MHVTAIVAAGGRGVRLGQGQPKQLLSVGGRTMLERSVAAFLSHPSVDEVIVALPPELVGNPPEYLLRVSAKPLRIVAGGERRQDSVGNAFRAASERSDVIVVHDAARPFVSAALIGRTIAAAAESGAAIAALPARDTVKLAVLHAPSEGTDSTERPSGRAPMPPPVVRETLARDTVFLAQTPQAFRRAILRDALAVDDDATDEATLAERAGHVVRLVEGEPWNIKITTAADVPIAEAIVRAGGDPTPAMQTRIGIGYDLHRLVPGRPLILGGVTIPFECGLLGFSDGDAICHAVTDAVLGAAAAGDIGGHFPDHDPAWAGASSIDLLRRAWAVVAGRGYGLANVDVVVIAERPKLAPHIESMRARLAAALDVAADCVSIKGKTNEGVGELGRGEAIAVHAVALLRAQRV